MSRRISDYFKIQPKKESTILNLSQVKEEKEEHFELIIENYQDLETPQKKIKIDESKIKIEKEIPISSNSKTYNRKCKYCSKNLKSERSFYNHIKTFHSDQAKVYNCTICNLKLICKRSFDSHLKNKHPNGQIKQFECDFDGKIFKSKADIYRHMETHMSQKECPICKAKISSQWMKYHISTFHEPNQQSQCEICLKFFSKNSINKHKRLHFKKLECDICSHKFLTLYKLNKHKMSHENLKTFKCDVCDKGFNQIDYLRKHKKLHDENRNNRNCQRCKFSTDYAKDYRKHEDYHKRQDEKIAAMITPVKCDICGKLCKNKQAIWQHKFFVHPKEQHQCDLCGRYLKKRHHLQRHMQLKHLSKRS